MPIIPLSNKYENPISSSVGVADVQGAGIAEANFFNKLAQFSGGVYEIAQNLYEKRARQERLDAATNGHKELLDTYMTEKNRLESPENIKALNESGGMVLNEEIGMEKPLPYDQYMDVFLNTHRKNIRERLIDLHDEDTGNMFNSLITNFDQDQMVSNIRQQAKFSNEGLGYVAKDFMNEISNNILNVPPGRTLTDWGKAELDMIDSFYAGEANKDKVTSAYYKDLMTKHLGKKVFERIYQQLSEPQTTNEAIDAAGQILGDIFTRSRDGKSIIMNRQTFDQLQKVTGDEELSVVAAKLGYEKDIYDENEFLSQARGKISPLAAYITPEDKARLLNAVMTMKARLDSSGDAAVKLQMKNYIKSFGEKSIIPGESINAIRLLDKNNPSVFNSQERANYAIESGVELAIGEMTRQQMMSPNKVINLDKMVENFSKESVNLMFPDDPEAIRLVTSDKPFLKGAIAKMQQRITEESISRKANMKANPDVYVFARDPEYARLENEIIRRDRPLNPKTLDSYIKRRYQLARTHNVELTKTYSKGVVDALSNKIKEGIELKTDAGSTIQAMRKATERDPWLFLEAIKSSGVTEEQKGAIIANSMGVYSEAENAKKLDNALKRADPEYMKTLNKALNLDEAGNRSYRNDVSNKLAPYLSGLKSILSGDKVYLKDALETTIVLAAKEKQAANPSLSKQEAINRAAEEHFSRIVPVDDKHIKGILNKSIFEKTNKDGGITYSDATSWADKEVSNFKSNLQSGKFKIDMNYYPDFKKLWGDSMIAKKSNPAEINKKFLNEFNDFYFVNTDWSGNKNEFVLYGIRNNFKEPVQIYIQGTDGKGYIIKAPSPQKMKRTGAKRNPSSIEEIMDMDEYIDRLERMKYDGR